MRAAEHAFLATRFQAIAHRGGLVEGGPLENTVAAFAQAVELGYGYVETDLHATSDGVLVAFHDDVLDRVTDGTGRIAELSSADLAQLRTLDGQSIPTFAELLETFPSLVFNLDLKEDGTESLLPPLLKRHRAERRVCVGSFSSRRLARFRRAAGPRVATSSGTAEVAAVAAFGHLATSRLAGDVLQIPVRWGRVRLLTPRLLRSVHLAGGKVHVWTVNNTAAMQDLIDAGVDGIVTDRIDELAGVLRARGLWDGKP